MQEYDLGLKEFGDSCQVLQLTWDLGLRHVIAEVDNLSVVNMVLRDEDIAGIHRGLILAIRKMMHKTWSVSLRHVYRERNFAADSLASVAAISAGGLSRLEEPSDEVNP
ncbi:OLC1v1024016C1 [Oldenlandia corymbosa var. corymbosa]|uniref:OLC1v1024016C1 n=1 Tax=Oldenlandia corymbosa var. corymbosa TaxID=529605 RepID=A0AAV1C194_OLDCO|nr:OLC1v1024016C1 [Oldenlandia corymbosa var. corymbosa]